MTSTLEAIDDANFEREVLGSSTPYLLTFSAAWCAPCRALQPILEELAREYRGQLRIGKLDIDESQIIAPQLGVRGAPTLILFQNGKVQARQLGLVPKRTLLKLLGLSPVHASV